jgi:hypothetical protein
MGAIEAPRAALATEFSHDIEQKTLMPSFLSMMANRFHCG